MKTQAVLLMSVLGFGLVAEAQADDAEVLRGRFSGAFTGAAPPGPVAVFDGVIRVDDDRLRFDGLSFVGVFPDGTICGSPVGVCSTWTTDEGVILNQTDSFIAEADGSFTQTLSFVGGTGEFEDVSGSASIKGSLDAMGGFEGRIRGVLLELNDDEEGDD